jgi:hypothetical protein
MSCDATGGSDSYERCSAPDLNKFRSEVRAVAGVGGSRGRERGEEREKPLEQSRGRGRACLASPGKINAVHCGTLVARACVGTRNACMSTALARRSTGVPVVACAKRRKRACSVRDGRPSSPSASTSL